MAVACFESTSSPWYSPHLQLHIKREARITAKRLRCAWIGADDVASEVLVRLVEVTAERGIEQCPPEYLFAVVTNTCRDLERRHSRQRRDTWRERPAGGDLPDIIDPHGSAKEIDAAIDMRDLRLEQPAEWQHVMNLLGDHGVKGLVRLLATDRNSARWKREALRVVLKRAGLAPD